MANMLTNYSNGMTYFQRKLGVVGKGQRYSIPFKKQTLCDVVATFTILGDVVVTEPPSFASRVENHSLTLDPSNINRDLFQKMSGAMVEVRITGSPEFLRGTIAGIESYNEIVQGHTVQRYNLVLLKEDGNMVTIAHHTVVSVRFTDSAAAREVQRALSVNYSKVKPDSTFIDFAVAPNGDNESEEVWVEYGVQTSAWAPRYEIKIDEEKNTKLEFAAKMDNPTDEDWEQYLVTCVVGDPTTFMTDIALVRTPKRRMEYLVSDDALGPVEVEQGMAVAMADGMEDYDQEVVGAESLGARGAPVRPRSPASLSYKSAPPQRAKSAEANVSEVGEYAAFEAGNPVDIRANRSSIIHMWEKPIDGRTILIYNSKNDRERPYRSVRLKNTVGTPLAKGVATVLIQDMYQGTGKMPASVPGEEVTIPHTRENGVRVLRTDKPKEVSIARVEIVRGMVAYEQLEVQQTQYRIRNNREEEFQFEIEHVTANPPGQSELHIDGVKVGDLIQTSDAVRVPFLLPKSTNLEMTATEVMVRMNRITLQGMSGCQWLSQNFFSKDHPISRDPKFNILVERQKALTEAQRKVQEGDQEIRTLAQEQGRLAGYLQSAKEGNPNLNQWSQDQAANEKRIRELERNELPTRRQAVIKAEEALQETLVNLTVTWSNTTQRSWGMRGHIYAGQKPVVARD